MINRRFLKLVRASIWRQSCFVYFGNFRNHLKFVKESRARDEGQPCKEELEFDNRSAEGARDTTGRARFEDSGSE